MFSIESIIAIITIIGLVIIFTAEMVERYCALFGQHDRDGVLIVKWCAVAMPAVFAALTLMPKLLIASALIFVGKIIITATTRRFV